MRCQSPARTAGGDALGVGAQAGPERGVHEGEDLVGDTAHLVGEHHLLDVHLVGDEVDEGTQPFGTGRGDREPAQRQAGAPAVGLAHGVGGRAHVAHDVHDLDQLGVGGELVGAGPVRQVDAALAGQAPVDRLR